MFIHDLRCISAQHSLDGSFFEGQVIAHEGCQYLAVEPSYEDLIPAGQLRRMGKAVRMGIGLALPMLQKNGPVGGIVLGTSDGGIEDSMKFLNQIVQFNEGALTPTNFVQSTPNSLAGQLALMSKNKGYNATHVNKGLAFESALADARLLLQEGEAKTVLAGNVEQFSIYNYNIEFLGGFFKEHPPGSEQLIDSGTPGTVCGEGSAMFMLSADSRGALAEILDVGQVSHITPAELEEKLKQFLASSKLVPSDIDALVLGFNGDSRTDSLYTGLTTGLFASQSVYSFKNLTGEYPTASGFALWLATHILLGKNIPAEAVRKNNGKKPANLLIYNHYKEAQHGFMLLRCVPESAHA
jgi:3-oxoacyl-(acyl-carrier-protein) synthase